MKLMIKLKNSQILKTTLSLDSANSKILLLVQNTLFWGPGAHYDQSVNIQFNRFISLPNALDKLLENTNIPVSQYGKRFRFTSLKCLP